MLDLFNELSLNHLTLSSVESFTGGLFASQLTELPGASTVFRGSIIPYQTDLKNSLLGLDADLLKLNGPVSEWTAQQMALLGKEHLKSDICVSFTGNAGPQSNDHTPVGLWYCAIAYPNGLKVFSMQSKGSRSTIRQEAVRFAITECIRCIKECHE